MNKTARIATLAAAAVALAAPATAQAKNFQHKGVVKGDDEAVVKLRVGLKSGEPAKIAGWRALEVPGRCGKRRTRITLRAEDPIRVRDDRTFRARFTDDEGGVLRLSGKVKDGGRKTKGKLSTNEFESGKKTCHVPLQRWVTKVR